MLLEPEAFAGSPSAEMGPERSSRKKTLSGVFPAQPAEVSVDHQPIKPPENFADIVTEVHLLWIGADAAVDRLVRLFGREAVKASLKKAESGRPPEIDKSTRYEFVWVIVETRRAALGSSLDETFKGISRRGGIPTKNGGEPLKTKQQIKGAYNRALAAIADRPDLERALIMLVQGNLNDWQKSGKTYDVFERELLPKYAIVDKPHGVR